MSNLTVNPSFSTDMEAITTKTPGHCDQWNTRHQQLLENDKYLYDNLKSEISRAKEADETLKSRVDNLTALKEGSTTGDAELQDIRVKADGTKAKNAGNAVREQFNELKSDLTKISNDLIRQVKVNKDDVRYRHNHSVLSKIKLNNYKVLFYDDFEGSVLDENLWNYVIAPRKTYNNELQDYVRDSISLKDSCLEIKCKRKNAGDNDYWTSGRIDTANKFEFGKGIRIEAKCKLPKVKGSWPAFWMYGAKPTNKFLSANNWPGNGEIDIFEQIDKNEWVQANVWCYTGSENKQNFRRKTLNDVSQWHVYACENDGENIRFYVDDELYHTVPVSETLYNGFTPYNDTTCSQRIVLNLAVGGNMPTSPDDTTPDEFNYYVDYVKVTSLYEPISIKELKMPEEVTIKAGCAVGIAPMFNEDSVIRTVTYKIIDDTIASLQLRHGKILGVKTGVTYLVAISESELQAITKIIVE